jgi:hypothetical protein
MLSAIAVLVGSLLVGGTQGMVLGTLVQGVPNLNNTYGFSVFSGKVHPNRE